MSELEEKLQVKQFLRTEDAVNSPELVLSGAPEAEHCPVRIGNYELLRKLGEGGMGTVHLARHVLLDKNFALKVINPSLVADPKVLERFRNEALAASALSHTNVSAVREFGHDDTFGPYIAMDYVEGRTLSQLLKEKGKLEPSECVVILDQICDALAHAHERGLIHRDIKPDNICISESSTGITKATLLDFGISTLQEMDEAKSRLTITGQIVGTLPYLSPEQALGRALSHKADIYSLGCVAIEMLTGKPPYTADTAIGYLAEHVNGQVPSLKNTPAVDFDAVVTKCLEKDPEKRYESLAELRNDLRTISAGRVPSQFSQWKPSTLLRRTGANIIDAVISTEVYISVAALFMGIFGALANHDLHYLLRAFEVWQGMHSTIYLQVLGLTFLDRTLPCFSPYLLFVLLWLMSGDATLPATQSPIPVSSLWIPVVNHPIARLLFGLITVFLVNWFYNAISLSSYGTTFGNKVCRLQVSSTTKQSISFIRASFHHFLRPLSLLIIPDLIRALLLWRKGNAHPFREVLAQPFHDWAVRIVVREKKK